MGHCLHFSTSRLHCFIRTWDYFGLLASLGWDISAEPRFPNRQNPTDLPKLPVCGFDSQWVTLTCMSHKTSFILILGMLTNMCVCVYVHTGKCTPIVKSGEKKLVGVYVHTGKCTPIVKVEKNCYVSKFPCRPPPQLLQCPLTVTMLNQFRSLLKPHRWYDCIPANDSDTPINTKYK